MDREKVDLCFEAIAEGLSELRKAIAPEGLPAYERVVGLLEELSGALEYRAPWSKDSVGASRSPQEPEETSKAPKALRVVPTGPRRAGEAEEPLCLAKVNQERLEGFAEDCGVDLEAALNFCVSEYTLSRADDGEG